MAGSGNNLKLSCGCSERNYLHRAIDTFTDAHPVLDKVLKTAFKIPSLLV
jgi:hypothetical protein